MTPRTTWLDPLQGTAYSAVRRLRVGGMCEVYEAATRSGATVAAKILRKEHAASPQLRDRMRLEADVLRRLRNTRSGVRALDFLETRDGRPAIVMDLLQGATLQDEVDEQGALPVSECLAWSQQALQAIQAIHELGVVHRDVKPDNLFLTQSRDGRRVRLIDYGYARPWRADSPIKPVNVATTDFVGTQRYAAPEQADPRSAARVDHRADLYAMGLVLYTLLTGRRPYARLDAGRALLAARRAEPPGPRVRLPDRLWQVLDIALARNREHRYSSADAFARTLAAVARELGLERRNEPPLEWRFTAREHARMTAELQAHPDQSERIRMRYGLVDEGMWLQAAAEWQRTVASDARLKRKWQREVERYRTELIERS